MSLLINKLSGVKIGVWDMSPARKRPCLVVVKDNCVTKYALFNNDFAAVEFMNILADFVEAERVEVGQDETD